MIKVIFIRHAESEYNKENLWCGRKDCSLTKEGLEKARELGRVINFNFDIIYCSPLKRAKETLFAIYPNSNPIYDERIIEISIGEWEGTKKNETNVKLREEFKRGLYFPKGAESHQNVDKRVNSFIEDLFTKYKNDETILVVTHNGVLRSIKRNFFEKINEKIMTNNLGILTITEKEYEFYKNKINIDR